MVHTLVKENFKQPKFFKIGEFDILMLSSNTLSELDTEFPFITKIIDAQTASGYIVHKNFVKKLLFNLKEALVLLEKSRSQEMYGNDIYWKKLQPTSNWYCLKPKVGKQMKSYSDNAKCVIDCGV
jgi:hypothetical protein